MPGHPIDVMVDELVRAAAGVAPSLERPLRRLSAGDRRPAAQALAEAATAGSRPGAADEVAVAGAFGRLARLLALVALPDGGARQVVQLPGSVGEVDADLEQVLRAVSLASPATRTLCELAALQVPGLLQWQAMLPPNNPWAGDLSRAVLEQVASAGAALVTSAESVGARTGPPSSPRPTASVRGRGRSPGSGSPTSTGVPAGCSRPSQPRARWRLSPMTGTCAATSSCSVATGRPHR